MWTTLAPYVDNAFSTLIQCVCTACNLNGNAKCTSLLTDQTGFEIKSKAGCMRSIGECAEYTAIPFPIVDRISSGFLSSTLYKNTLNIFLRILILAVALLLALYQ
jgi:hypothetical protein